VDIIREFFGTYENIVRSKNIPPQLIWNTDETQLGGSNDRKKQATKKGDGKPCKKQSEEEEHITLVPWVNAVGDSLSTTAIFPLKTIPALSDQVMESFNISGSSKGWITGPVMKNITEIGFAQELHAYREKKGLAGREALLLLDNHSSRNSLDFIRLCADHQVTVLPLPPNSTAMLQPLDLGPNGVLKQIYYKIHRKDNSLDAKERRNIATEDAHEAISAGMSLHMIRVGWRRTGLWPVDVEVPLKSKMAVASHKALPAEKKRKRGKAFGESGVLYRGRDIVRLEEENKENIGNK
jgi:hypothetical protein